MITARNMRFIGVTKQRRKDSFLSPTTLGNRRSPPGRLPDGLLTLPVILAVLECHAATTENLVWPASCSCKTLLVVFAKLAAAFCL
jgi:hypothetical protein